MVPKCPYCKRPWTRQGLDSAVWCVNGHWWYNDSTWLERMKEVLQWSF